MIQGLEVIDFHIHPFYSKENNFCFYEDTVNDYKDIENDLKKSGIDIFCGSVIKKEDITDFEQIRKLNNEALYLKDLYKRAYIPGIHIHPNFVQESIDELEKMNRAGVKLVGELVPYLMGWNTYYNENMIEILKKIDELGMVVSIHTKDTYEDCITKVVKEFPDITFVAAHPGDKTQFFNHLERMKKFDNYYLDLSGTGIFRYGLIKKAVKEVGSEKILFGTDYPICNPSMYVNCVLFEKLKDCDYENIFSKNARRILKL